MNICIKEKADCWDWLNGTEKKSPSIYLRKHCAITPQLISSIDLYMMANNKGMNDAYYRYWIQSNIYDS